MRMQKAKPRLAFDIVIAGLVVVAVGGRIGRERVEFCVISSAAFSATEQKSYFVNECLYTQ